MKILKYLVVTAIAVAGLASQSNASLTDLGLIQPLPSSPIGSEQAEADFVETYLGLSFQLQPVLPKIEDPAGGASSFNISWDLTGTGLQLNFVLVKDGAAAGTGGDQLYRLYGVTDDQKLASGSPQTVMIDQDNNGTPDKAISHITFLGSAAPSVPDGGATVMLLGTALGCLGALRRRLA
jgi:protein with PEP-CTERM/exosortase system signal